MGVRCVGGWHEGRLDVKLSDARRARVPPQCCGVARDRIRVEDGPPGGVTQCDVTVAAKSSAMSRTWSQSVYSIIVVGSVGPWVIVMIIWMASLSSVL